MIHTSRSRGTSGRLLRSRERGMNRVTPAPSRQDLRRCSATRATVSLHAASRSSAGSVDDCAASEGRKKVGPIRGLSLSPRIGPTFFLPSDAAQSSTEPAEDREAAWSETVARVAEQRRKSCREGAGVTRFIPLSRLRSNLPEVPRDRDVWIICAAGQRAYFAQRLMLQNGYRARNLSGGYQTYAERDTSRPRRIEHR